MSTLRKLAGQTATYGLSTIVGRLLNYLLVPLHTALFLPEEYGVVSEFYAYVAFFVVVLTFGMETTFFRFANAAKDKENVARQAISLIVLLNGAFLVAAIVSSSAIARWMGYPHHRDFVIWMAAILAMDAFSSLLLARLRLQQRSRKFAQVQLIAIGVNVGFNLLFLLGFHQKSGAASYGIGYIFLANLIASGVKPLLLYREISTFRWVWNRSMVREMVVFAAPLVIAGLAGMVNETIDRILIKRLLMGTQAEQLKYAQEQVGIYAANYKLSILMTLFVQAFRYAAEPFFFAQAGNRNSEGIYAKVMTYFIAVVALLFLVVALNLELFKWFIPNERYHQGLTIVPILLLANLCLGIYYNQSIWYKLANKTLYGAYIAVGGAVVTLAMNRVWIPVMGYEAAAWTTLTVYFSMMVASYYLGKKHYPIRYNLRKAGLYLFTALGLFFIGNSIAYPSLAVRVLVSSSFIALFIALFLLMEQPLRLLKKK